MEGELCHPRTLWLWHSGRRLALSALSSSSTVRQLSLQSAAA